MRLLFAATFLFIALHALPQKRNNSVEVQPYFRHDTYPAFTYAINPVTTNTVKMQGTSFGVLGSYGYGLSENMKAKIGIGYYRYSFNKINSFNSSYGEGNARVIIYPVGDVIYTTNKYWYHTLYLSGGLEKYIPLTKQIDLLLAGSIQYYRTFSQYYKIFDTKSYEINDGKNMGLGGSVQVGLAYKISRYVIAPQFILPIYDQWHQDKVFPGEKNNDTRSKWIRGYGAAIGIQYELSGRK